MARDLFKKPSKWTEDELQQWLSEQNQIEMATDLSIFYFCIFFIPRYRLIYFLLKKLKKKLE